MKNLLLSSFLLASLASLAQGNEYRHNNKKGELNTETPTSKTFQGALSGTMFKYATEAFVTDNPFVSSTVGLLASLALEALFNKGTNFEKASFVAAGSLTISITIETLKGDKYKYCVGRH